MGVFNLRIIICDDEKAYVDSVQRNVDSFLKEKNMEASYSLYTDCNEFMQNNSDFFDIAFLDIEMGEIKGTQVAEELKKINPHIIVFIITSYDQYLDEAMDLNVFRYIKKPLDEKRLLNGLDKAIQLLDKTVIEFYLKSNNTLEKVISSDIVYVEIVGHSTKVVTINGEYISKNNMRFWKEKLSASFFFPVHSSFIVNVKFITKYERYMLTLNNKHSVPVAYRSQAAFKRYFMKYNGGR